ncbi:MAG: translation initiation factor IF-2 subunit beta [Candidatus Diapherotrites archaeon CG11_big_fil_rev_8_21_14_0_20_37_9]|nr:MAG: translation initiation factor IF-2 subunit beta [Candidatus Diapherotrites archaeon CG11_big_fil_rev_8_21_14_0_20_37_9]
MEYEKMLNRLYGSLPEKTTSKERFEIPRLDSRVQGKKTMVNNFSAVVKLIGREEKHVYKYFAKETASSLTIESGKLIMNGKFYPDMLGKLFDSYLKEFVYCHECGKPDTKIVDNQGIKMLKCTACGALSPLKKI